ncbi:reverse transcriptase domain-containing protein [Tanacetum coccineum]|uniref:Reverse transcriptase domain-containing protein n=1 Tax=Tanacetum coccineum TaxID=301880 RepID=A0ABQ5C1B2_9ASTR
MVDELDSTGSNSFLPHFLECDSVLYEDFSEVDTLTSTDNEDKVFNPGILIHENLYEVTNQVTPDKNVKKKSSSNASLILEDFYPPLSDHELPFHIEIPGSGTLLSFSSENEEKVFNLRILISKGVHSLLPELSHWDSKAFKDEGIDFEESFSPIASLESVRIFIAYDAYKSFSNGYVKNGQKQSKTDKTEHGNGKSIAGKYEVQTDMSVQGTRCRAEVSVPVRGGMCQYEVRVRESVPIMSNNEALYDITIAWYDRLPRNSIYSFDDMMRKFLSKYFPPSMVTKLRNEITKFEQKPHRSLFEAWECYKLSIDRCPNHNMVLVTQIDTFYDGLTLSHRDTINAAAGGTFMKKTPEECYELIENMTIHHNHWDTSATRDETSRNISSTTTTESPEVVRQLEIMNKNFVEMMRQMQSVKSVNPKCQTCGGPHSFTECPAADGYTQEAVYATTGNHNLGGNSYQPQGDRNLLSYRSNNYLGPPGFNQPNVQNNQNRYNQNQGNFQAPNYQAPNNQGRGKNFNQGNNNYQAPNFQAQVGPSNELTNYIKSNEATLRAMQTHMTNMKTELRNEFKSTIDARTNKIENQNNQIMNILTNMQNQNSSGSGSLPSNTIANPRGDVKATTRSGVAYDGPTIPPTPSPLPKEVEHETKATNDKTNPKPSIPYPSRLNDQKLREKANNQMLKFLQIFQRLHFDISFADALLYMPKFASTFKSLLSNMEKLFKLASTPLNENCSAVLLKQFPKKLGDPDKFLIPCDFPELDECLALADLGASINLMPLSVWKQLSLPELTSTRMTLKLANRSTVIPEGGFVKVGKFYFLANFIVVDYDVDPRVPLHNVFNDLPNVFTHPPQPQYESYSCELCGNDSHYGYDFPPRLPLVYEQEQYYNQNFSDNYYPQNSPSFPQQYLCCENCGGPHESFQCQPMNQNHFEHNSNYSGFDQPLQYSIDHQEDLNQQRISDVHFRWDKIEESLLNMMQSFYEVASTIPLNDNTSQIPPSIAITLVLPIKDSKDSLSMGDEHLSTIPEKESDEFIKSSVEDLVTIPSESEDTSESDSDSDLPLCDDFSLINISEKKYVTFSNPLFDSNDYFTSSDDESLSDEDVLEDKVKIYSNPLFEFDDEYISSDINPLFDEVLDNIERKDFYDEPDLLVTPLSAFNEDECFDPGGDIDEIDTTPNLPPNVFLDYDPRSLKDEPDDDDLMTKDKVFDPGILEKIFSPTYVRLPFEDRHYLSLTYVIQIFLPYFTYPVDSSFLLYSGSEDTIFDLGISAFHSLEPVVILICNTLK